MKFPMFITDAIQCGGVFWRVAWGQVVRFCVWRFEHEKTRDLCDLSLLGQGNSGAKCGRSARLTVGQRHKDARELNLNLEKVEHERIRVGARIGPDCIVCMAGDKPLIRIG